MDYRKINYEEFAAIYSQHRNASERVISNIITYTKEQEIGEMLEIGCGTADYLYILKQLMNCKAYGFDRSNEMLNKAALKNPYLNLSCGNASDYFPYEDSRFDFAYSVNVIHYIDNLDQYFNEIYRTLNEHGQVLTVTVSYNEMRENIQRYFPEFGLDGAKESLVERIITVMTKVGFKDIEITKSDYEYKMDEESLIPFESKAFAWLKLLSDKGFKEGIELMKRDISNASCAGSENFTYIWGRK